MNNMKHKILMTLALLITAVGGAWAAEFTSLKVGDVLHVGDVINTNTNYTVYGYYLDASYQPATLVRADISGPTTITESETGAYYLLKGNDGYFYGVIQDLLNGYTGGYWPVTATSDGISVTAINPGSSTELTFDVHEGSSTEPPLAVEWNASTKTGTFEMPAYDVELTPLYAPVAQWAKVENVDQLPTAIEGIFAGTDNAIVNAGTVVEGQGQAMYFATTDAEMTAEKAAKAEGWLADVPTAEGYDGAQTVYVWYYIKGADAPQGQTATAENTFNDTEICAEPIKVEVLSNKFDIQFNAANDNTIEAGKATVTVGGTAATVTEGKLEGVKMGSEVKMTAKEGYKFRKVEVKKSAAPRPLAEAVAADLGKIAGADGNIYDTKAAAEAANTTAVAMIAYVGTASDCAHGLAIALADESGTKDFGAAGTACSGKAAVTGGTWRLPSIKDWQYMFIGCGASGSYSDNPSSMSYSGLASKLTTAQGDALQPGYYWSSTEYFPGTDAWDVSFDGSSNASFGPENESIDSPRVRACLAF